MSEKTLICRDKLISLANQALKEHQDYFDGVEVHEVIQTPETLIFKGEAFLDKDGLPTLKSTEAFNLYKWLSHQYKDAYELQA